MTRVEANKEFVRRRYGTLMAVGDVAAVDEVLAPDDLDHDLPGAGEGGRAELIGAVLAVRAAFPDVRPVLHQLVGEGDLVAAG